MFQSAVKTTVQFITGVSQAQQSGVLMGGKRSVCGHKGEQVTSTSTCTAEISLFALSLSQHRRLDDSLHQHECAWKRCKVLPCTPTDGERTRLNKKQEVKTQLVTTTAKRRRDRLRNRERTSEESHQRGMCDPARHC